ncbi:MAG: YbhB/YbcL family Raf kinase inhibitor-like protein [Myxococcota bacterium]|nr:YbhB/YbcL family Raf kinase inhibitor-like protein [Myxococcota bacterium]
MAHLALFALLACAHTPQEAAAAPAQVDEVSGQPFTLQVRSDTLQAGQPMPLETVFDGFGCTGGNVSPQLSWSAGPEGTASYAVMMYDPDAPTGVGFHHWWVANLSPETLSLAEGAAGSGLPEGAVEGRNDYSTSTYGGPCPPEGRTHRYQFTVWALDSELPVDENTSAAVVRFLVRNKTLAAGRLEATYAR